MHIFPGIRPSVLTLSVTGNSFHQPSVLPPVCFAVAWSLFLIQTVIVSTYFLTSCTRSDCSYSRYGRTAVYCQEICYW